METKSSSSTNSVKTFKVGGMSCNHCKMSVEKAVSSVPGVDSVEVDLPSGNVYIKGVFDTSSIIEAVESIGFTIEG